MDDSPRFSWTANGQPAPPASDSPLGIHRAILDRLTGELAWLNRQRTRIQHRLEDCDAAREALRETYAALHERMEDTKHCLAMLDIIGRDDEGVLADFAESVDSLVAELRGTDLDEIAEALEGPPPMPSPN